MHHPVPSSVPVGIPRFREALAFAQDRFTALRSRYPRLKGYLVLSNPAGQSDIGGDLASLLDKFPGLFLDTPSKSEALALLRAITHSMNADGKKELDAQIEARSSGMWVDGSCQVEIRFDFLDYDLIWKLQADELINQNLTPRSRASIRIVLGTISDLARQSLDNC